MDCGQSWRAASLLGGGPNGPTPLGDNTAVKNSVACKPRLRKAIFEHSCGTQLWAAGCTKLVPAIAV